MQSQGNEETIDVEDDPAQDVEDDPDNLGADFDEWAFILIATRFGETGFACGVIYR